MYRLLLFDRDGTLTYEREDYHRDLSRLFGYPFTSPVLKAFHTAGYLLAVVTNQSGIARGYWKLGEVETAHRRLCREWDVTPSFHICPHHPDDGCDCRKPAVGLLNEAMDVHGSQPEESLMIGDSLGDYLAARESGMHFGLVLTGRGRVTRSQLPSLPTMVLDTIADLESHV
ncbi:MAG: HAD-IIIA family hydrolase [Fidelibacterota bacterium]|nr:MAG: HAD-IIIA family hydrolase [Candidatus Neomarinimicrobiota bacterium]